MYVRNDTDIAILYTVVGGGVTHGTLLPGQQVEVQAAGGAEHIAFDADGLTTLPDTLTITLASR